MPVVFLFSAIVSGIALGVISGLGPLGYLLGLEALLAHVGEP